MTRILPPAWVFALMVSGTVAGLAAIDLVLPSVPRLPALLGGTTEQGQYVLAAYVGGSGLGLLLFGALGARYSQARLLAGSLATFGFLSVMASLATSMESLIVLRAAQGIAGAAAAVFAPGMIRAVTTEAGALKMIGLLSSIESLVPALAPVLGFGLLQLFGWQASFLATAGLCGLILIALRLVPGRLPTPSMPAGQGSFLILLRNRNFMLLTLSHAFALGALLSFVFSAPAVIVGTMDGTIPDFIKMQITGISLFILAANLSPRLAGRWGERQMLWLGTLIPMAGAAGVLAFAIFGNGDAFWLIFLFAPVNFGFGLRGPVGFLAAVKAAGGDDARGSALLILAILGVSSGATAAIAPFITLGLMPLAAMTLGLWVVSASQLALKPTRAKRV